MKRKQYSKMRGVRSLPESANPGIKMAGQHGSVVNLSVSKKTFVEMEVTHEVFFGENIKRVIRAIFGK